MSVALAAVFLVQCSPAPQLPAVPPSSAATATTPPAVVQAVSAADLGATWRPGCPVSPDELRRVDLDYVGLDGLDHRGVLIVHRDVVADVVAIFADLHRQRYPIAKMQTPQHYPGAVDDLSMEDNNTSAFNCRPLPGSTAWSLHAYGRAIDLNPLFNPYLDRSGDLEPATAGSYLDRRRTDPGILHAADAAVRAFTDRGWTWGGDWRNPIDYQHFERR
ncbi:M15 family metallopeptidase [Mycobacterium sp. ELW1]|uniref:M15 family metallopeptidase n=1 Tax=Mycobacterium sp. ELW1 TaxID=1547487 RepID=UPI0011EF8EEC|nr:M15 family metallopeptidase [Mycobacterium sp. ELW1]QEN15291.1 M15 family metallopeptidase [Mycobacterium sp. ELW1]